MASLDVPSLEIREMASLDVPSDVASASRIFVSEPGFTASVSLVCSKNNEDAPLALRGGCFHTLQAEDGSRDCVCGATIASVMLRAGVVHGHFSEAASKILRGQGYVPLLKLSDLFSRRAPMSHE